MQRPCKDASSVFRFLLPWGFGWSPDSVAKAKEKRLPPVSPDRLRGSRLSLKHMKEDALGARFRECRQRKSFHGFVRTTLAVSKLVRLLSKGAGWRGGPQCGRGGVMARSLSHGRFGGKHRASHARRATGSTSRPNRQNRPSRASVACGARSGRRRSRSSRSFGRIGRKADGGDGGLVSRLG